MTASTLTRTSLFQTLTTKLLICHVCLHINTNIAVYCIIVKDSMFDFFTLMYFSKVANGYANIEQDP